MKGWGGGGGQETRDAVRDVMCSSAEYDINYYDKVTDNLT